MDIVLWCIIIIIVLYFLLVLPCNHPKSMKNFEGWYYAHRGYFDNASDAPENSKRAMRMAVNKGYGIELDVQLTKDEKVVVFHDSGLWRACGVDAKVNSLTYEELQQLHLFDSNEKIPLFSDVLKLIDGKVPIIVEIKMVNGKTRICELASAELASYKGAFCVESFHPFAVRWFMKNHPEIIRGQLSANFKKEGQKEGVQEWLVHMLLVDVLGRPDFVAYSHKSANNISRCLTRMCGAAAVAWTIRSQEELDSNRKKFDLFIFEGFQPDKEK